MRLVERADDVTVPSAVKSSFSQVGTASSTVATSPWLFMDDNGACRALDGGILAGLLRALWDRGNRDKRPAFVHPEHFRADRETSFAPGAQPLVNE